MKRSIWVAALAAAALLTGCEKDEGGKGYDDEDLARYKSALPARSTVSLRNPPSGAAAAFGATPTVYPEFAVPIAMQVNGFVGGTLDIIELIAEQEPTLYDSEDLEFWWGPIPDAESTLEGDHWSLFIHDRINDADFNPQDGDLRYEFAIIRGLGNDVASLTPILYGQATPIEGSEDHGLGVFIYDFDNNVEFENTYNAGHGPLTEGRMATIFAKGPDETTPTTEVTFVVAAFRDFLPEDAGAEPALNVDYFWGNFSDAANSFDFIDMEFLADVINDTAAAENLDMKLAFYNSGVGRAEVGVTNGDLGLNDLAAVECWDAQVTQTYLTFTLDTGMGPVTQGESGVAADCVWDTTQFDQVPDLSDVAEMQSLVDLIANTGIPSDIPDENG